MRLSLAGGFTVQGVGGVVTISITYLGDLLGKVLLLLYFRGTLSNVDLRRRKRTVSEESCYIHYEGAVAKTSSSHCVTRCIWGY